MNSVTARFDTTVRQMTEMSQWPKCLSKNDWNVSLTKMSQQKITEISQRKKPAEQTRSLFASVIYFICDEARHVIILRLQQHTWLLKS